MFQLGVLVFHGVKTFRGDSGRRCVGWDGIEWGVSMDCDVVMVL